MASVTVSLRPSSARTRLAAVRAGVCLGCQAGDALEHAMQVIGAQLGLPREFGQARRLLGGFDANGTAPRPGRRAAQQTRAGPACSAGRGESRRVAHRRALRGTQRSPGGPVALHSSDGSTHRSFVPSRRICRRPADRAPLPLPNADRSLSPQREFRPWCSCSSFVFHVPVSMASLYVVVTERTPRVLLSNSTISNTTPPTVRCRYHVHR